MAPAGTGAVMLVEPQLVDVAPTALNVIVLLPCGDSGVLGHQRSILARLQIVGVPMGGPQQKLDQPSPSWEAPEVLARPS